MDISQTLSPLACRNLEMQILPCVSFIKALTKHITKKKKKWRNLPKKKNINGEQFHKLIVSPCQNEYHPTIILPQAKT